jgi:hypothetical protein
MLLPDTCNQTLQIFSELSWDDLYIRYAAMHIVILPITVSAAWIATNTYNSLQKTIHFICTAPISHSIRFLVSESEEEGVVYGGVWGRIKIRVQFLTMKPGYSKTETYPYRIHIGYRYSTDTRGYAPTKYPN